VNARRWAYAALFGVTLLIYAIMVTWSLPRIAAEAGGLRAFDLRPMGYSFQEAKAFLAALSPEGSQFYLDTQHHLDLVYPGLLALTLALGLWHLLRSSSTIVRLALLVPPILSAVFDYLENARVSVMLTAGASAVTMEMVAAASRATVFKSVFGAVAMTSLLIVLVIRWARHRRGASHG
jgi:hypothetical protein